MSTEALAPVVEKEPITPVYSGADMVRALAGYRELQTKLDHAMPDQIIALDGRPFRKKGYWRAVAMAFNLTIELVNETRDVYGVLDNGAENYGYRVTYRASTRGGRSSVGDGTCTAAEKSRGRMRASEHNVRSHSHTRAMNRAISNLCAFGEVSAEEADDETPIVKHKHASAPAPDPGEAAFDTTPTPASAKEPINFKAWFHALRIAAKQGDPALRQAWEHADSKLKRHLRENDPNAWESLKEIALRATAAQREADEDGSG